MTSDTDTTSRVDKLTEARRRVSQTKTTQALAAVERLHAAGEPVTFAGVARSAAVSTWFAYNNRDVAAAIRRAQGDQAEHGLRPAPPTLERVTAASLRVDLEHARDEVRALRADKDQLRRVLSLKLGAELENGDPAELLNRIVELEQHNLNLARELSAATEANRQVTGHLHAVEAELAAARESLRRSMRAVP